VRLMCCSVLHRVLQCDEMYVRVRVHVRVHACVGVDACVFANVSAPHIS